MQWIPWTLSGCGVLIALISLLRTFLVAARDQSAYLKERIGLLEMKIGLFWRLVEEHMSGMLKAPTHLEMDLLLDKLKAHTLTLPEATRLRWWLRKVYLEDEVADAQRRMTAILVLAAVESLIHEFERVPPSLP